MRPDDEEPAQVPPDGYGAYPRRYWGIGGEGFRRSRRWVEPEPPNESFAGVGPRGFRRSDERIVDDVWVMLADDPLIDARDMTVEVQDGEVRLRGTVPGRRMRRRAWLLVDGVSGVHDVLSELRVRRDGGRDGD